MPRKSTTLTPAKQRKLLDKLVNKVYRNAAPLLISEAALFIVVGVLMLVNPIIFLGAFTFVVGIGLILFGLYRVSIVFVSNLGASVGFFDVFVGLVTLGLGLVFCVYPQNSAVGMIYVFVALFLVNALRMFAFAINMARVRVGHYVVDMLISGGMVVLAVALLFVPSVAGGALVWAVAIYLLIYAGVDLYMFIKLLRLRRVLQYLE